MLKVLFIGTDEFGIPTLEALMSSAMVDLVGIVTQPDRPAGRKQELQPSQIKQHWQANLASLVNLYQPEKLKLEADHILLETQPDLIIVAAYGQIVPDIMLKSPQFKCLNIHASLLPHLRGAVPIPMAILEGLTQTGVSIQQMASGLDTGDLLGSLTAVIYPADNSDSLKTRLANLGAELLMELLPKWVNGEIQLQPQDESQATLCKQADIERSKAEIKFETEMHLASRMVRAFNPEPVAWVEVATKNGLKQVRIFEALAIEDQMVSAAELKIIRQGKQLFLVLQNGMLELREIQIAGKERRVAFEYLSSFDYLI